LQVFVLHGDGSVSQVTRGRLASDVQGWSPDGSWLLIDRYDRHDQVLYVVRADGRVRVPLTGGPLTAAGSDWAGSAVWSPDGTHIAFERSTGFGVHKPRRFGVVIATWDGSRVTGRTWLPGSELSGSDPWSADGSRLLLVRPNTIVTTRQHHHVLIESTNIALVRADGTEYQRLTKSDWTTCQPSPEGKGDQVCDQYGFPSWSVDGHTILTMRGGISADGEPQTALVRLSPRSGTIADVSVVRELDQPGWSLASSPDGSLVAIGGRAGISTMWPDGSHLRRVTTLLGSAMSWSPDGSRLVFFGTRRDCTSLYVVGVDDSQLAKLSTAQRPYSTRCAAFRSSSGPYWRPTG
jgi:Tol biopolymer transport system component